MYPYFCHQPATVYKSTSYPYFFSNPILSLRFVPHTRKYNNQNWLPSIFNDFFDNEWLTRANATAPAINVIESDKDYKVEVAAPGMTKEDFNIHISENNELVISMEKKNETKEDDHHNRRYLRREFSYSKFEQALILPEDVVKEKISANASNGVLTIDLPKRTPEEKAKVNRIIEIH